MAAISTQLAISLFNLMIGLAVGWFVGRMRDRVRSKSPTHDPAVEVAEVLGEIDNTIEQQIDSWSSLRDLLTNNATLSRNEVDIHVNSNRFYGRLLQSCSERLERCDPYRNYVSKELSDQISASQQDAGTFAGDLERVSLRTSDPAVRDLLKLLREMQQSNQALRSDLQFARERIIEQTDRLKRAEAAALQDPLTGLPNRRAFEGRYRELEARYDRHRRPYALLLIDLDRFKDLNDTYGHEAGDATLQVAARVMNEVCRVSDHLSRYGGEEFAVLAGEADSESAFRLAERIRLRVEQASVLHGDVSIDFTCSVGVALMQPDRTRGELIDAADAALYDAKAAGRNTVRGESPPKAGPSAET
ncbi:MAG: GGDEF domain-containing protein [Planctomycetaceae bacterium]